jgi:predicted patatin/cPLA2 family phospholipase
MEQTGLVLEGGGMRGVYTAGILDFFMEKGVYLPYVIGVSAGACHGSSYVSRQPGRSKAVTVDYIEHPRYVSYRNFIRERSLFGMDFIFDELPNRLVPFDFPAFFQSRQEFVVGTTDCVTGDPVYFTKNQDADMLSVLRASSSLPLLSPPVSVDGYTLLDGGISDPIPIRKSEKDGNAKNIVILTRDKNYRKTPVKMEWMVRKLYPRYRKLVDKIIERHRIYNETLDYINKQEKDGNVFIIRPTNPVQVDRIEKNKEKLNNLYEQGYEDAQHAYEPLSQWLHIK